MYFLKDILILFLNLSLLQYCYSIELPKCKANSLKVCGNIIGIICNESTDKCECDTNYVYDPNSPDLYSACTVQNSVPNNSNNEDNSSHTVSIVVVILLTILLLGSALFFIVRRYNLLHWVHNKIFSRRDAGATYEDVMIGQDDPPISA